jgi:hypothetical protein
MSSGVQQPPVDDDGVVGDDGTIGGIANISADNNININNINISNNSSSNSNEYKTFQQQQPQLPVVDDPCVYNHPDDTDDYKRSYALNYHLRKKPKTIFAMAIGFPEFHGILDRPPLSTIKRKELNDQYIPKAEDFKQEIKRRSHFFMHVPDEATYYAVELQRDHPLKTKRSSIVLPQPNQWLNTQLRNWLAKRPMKPTDEDVKFIRYHVKRALDYLAQEGTDGTPEAIRELPIIPTPIDADVGPDIMTVPSPGGDDGAAAAAAGGTAAGLAGADTRMSLVGGGVVGTTGDGMEGFGGLQNIPGGAGDVGIDSIISSITPAATDIETDKFIYDGVGDNTEYKRSAAETFLLKGSKPRILFALAMGMPEYADLLQTAAYNLIKRKEVMEDFMPRAEDYKYEIKRRAHFFNAVEEEVNYYTSELKLKNPLENMRGIVTLPQPNQWKLQALKLWLSERPLRPNPKDGEFLRAAIQKSIHALRDAMAKDPALAEPLSSNKRSSTVLMNMVDPSIGTMGGSIATGAGGASIAHVLQKQDAILSALRKQSEQQTIMNKITLLTQSSMGYQHELASLRSTRSNIEGWILTVEMKLAETTTSPESREHLMAIKEKHAQRFEDTNQQISNLEPKIASIKSEIQAYKTQLEKLEMPIEEEDVASAAASSTAGAGNPLAVARMATVDGVEGTEQAPKKRRYEEAGASEL